MYFEQKNLVTLPYTLATVCLSLEIFMPVLRENVSLKKNETAKQMEVFLISHNGAIFFYHTQNS